MKKVSLKKVLGSTFLPSDSSKQVNSINLLRFIAAFSVMMYHYTFMFYHRGNSYLDFPLFRFLFHYGYLGVDLFFIISGFVIALSAEGKSFKDFTISRMTRLYPVLWISVTITGVIFFLFAPSVGEKAVSFPMYLANLTMLPSLFHQGQIDGSYWSLIVELKFYAFIGLLLLLGFFTFINEGALFGSLLLFVSAFFFGLPTNYSSYFLAGILFYCIYKRGLSVWHLAVLPFLLAVSLKYAASLAPSLSAGYQYPFDPQIIQLYIFSLYTLFFLIATKKVELSDRKVYKTLGAITYPLYLLHQEIGRLFYKIAKVNGLNHWVAFFVVTGVVIVTSYLVQRFYEKKAQLLLKRTLVVITKRVYAMIDGVRTNKYELRTK